MTFHVQIETSETRTAFFDIEARTKVEAEDRAREMAKTERALFTVEGAVKVSFLEA